MYDIRKKRQRRYILPLFLSFLTPRHRTQPHTILLYTIFLHS
nr:MAG TPA: hypothetical protein [Caudoviricetes sp.]